MQSSPNNNKAQNSGSTNAAQSEICLRLGQGAGTSLKQKPGPDRRVEWKREEQGKGEGIPTGSTGHRETHRLARLTRLE